MNEKSMSTRVWDKIGICASGLCLVHCLATPILLLLFPATKITLLDSHLFHEIFAVIVVSSIMLAVYPHCKKHGHTDIIGIALIGVVLVIISIFSHDLPVFVSHGMTIVGSIFLITAHIKNMKVRHGKCASEKSCSSH
jgi:hypothetical protein